MEWRILPPKFTIHALVVEHDCKESAWTNREYTHIYHNHLGYSITFPLINAQGYLGCIYCHKSFPDNIVTQLKLMCD